MPQTIGGQKVNYIVLDDASDTTTAVNNTRKLITEDKVDVILGSTITPNSLAMIDVVAESADADDLDGGLGAHRRAGRRQAALGLQDAAERHHDVAGHRRSTWPTRGIKTVGFIGFADAYGEGWCQEFSKTAEIKGLNDRRQRALRRAPTRRSPGRC